MQMKKRYEAPTMIELVVELEEGFMGGSVVDDRKKTKVEATQQDYVEFDCDTQSDVVTWE